MMNRQRMITFPLMQYIVIALVMIILQSCANPLPPTGGPRDTEGPLIIRTIPKDRTIGFNEKTITIEFNEYVDRNKVLQNIHITPTITYEATWSGRELELTFTESLQSNTTYSLTIGTDYADYAGNRPLEAKTVIFSTGSALDTGSISGMVAGQSLGVSVFLLPVNDSIESFNPTKSISMYKTQIGSNGQFTFSALSNGRYRIYAIQDIFKDGFYDIGTDGYAMASRDVTVPTNIAPVMMNVTKPKDTIAPTAMQALSQGSGLIEIRCSEIILEQSINASQFMVVYADGTIGKSHAAYSYPGRSTSLTIEHDSLMSVRKVQLNAEILQATDSSGNQCKDGLQSTELLKAEAQSKTPNIYSLSVKDSSVIDIVPNIELVFSHSIDYDSLPARLTLSNGKGLIPLSLRKVTDNHVSISTIQPLQPDAWHTLRMNLKGLKDKRGAFYADTSVTIQLQSIDSRLFGAIKGEIRDDMKGGPYIISMKSDKGKTIIRSIEQSGLFKLNDIPSGSYTIHIFEDKNKDGEYDFGSITPFRFSERFTTLKDSVTVRPRWAIDGILLQFREP